MKKERWITVNGNHVLIKEGQSVKEALSERFGDARGKKRINKGKYEYSMDEGKTWEDMDKQSYDEMDADKELLDVTTDEDFKTEYVPQTKLEKQVDEWIRNNWDRIDKNQELGALAYKMGGYGIRGEYPLVLDAVGKSIAAMNERESSNRSQLEAMDKAQQEKYATMKADMDKNASEMNEKLNGLYNKDSNYQSYKDHMSDYFELSPSLAADFEEDITSDNTLSDKQKEELLSQLHQIPTKPNGESIKKEPQSAEDKYAAYKEKGKSTWNQKLSKGDKITFKDRSGNDVTGYINGFYKGGELQDEDTYEEGKDNLWHDFRGLGLVDENGKEIGNINAFQILKHEKAGDVMSKIGKLGNKEMKLSDALNLVSKAPIDLQDVLGYVIASNWGLSEAEVDKMLTDTYFNTHDHNGKENK